MATGNEKLANSLSVLEALQKAGKHVVRSSDLSRTHLTRLKEGGYLEEVIKGWFLASRPELGAKGSSAAWFIGMREFIAGYCNARFGDNWHLAPDQSLMLRTGERSLPKQIQIWAPAANNQPVSLPHGCSMFLYRPARLHEAQPVADAGGMRLVTVPAGLVAVGPAFFTQQPLAARIALDSVADVSELLRPLLDGSHSQIAGRLAGAMRAVHRASEADEILETMRAAGHTVVETQPFDAPQNELPGGRAQSPYVQRLRLMWAQMREVVVEVFPRPGPVPTDVQATVADVSERYVADAYHSLSIEGYRVTPELIEKVRNGDWDTGGADAATRDALAAKGYYEAHTKVKDFIGRTVREHPSEWPLRDALTSWYRELFGPSVAAGILKASDLAGWRAKAVFLRGAMHVPLSPEAVLDTMPVFFELLAKEPDAAVRAVLGHFFFVYIHPYMDGNGRLGRFIMNSMLVPAGYVWTIVPMPRRADYMAALEQASTYRNIRPLAEFIGGLVIEQTAAPLPRPGSR